MNGSFKQIDWATQLRDAMLADKATLAAEYGVPPADADDFAHWLDSHEDAGWWIDHFQTRTRLQQRDAVQRQWTQHCQGT